MSGYIERKEAIDAVKSALKKVKNVKMLVTDKTEREVGEWRQLKRYGLEHGVNQYMDMARCSICNEWSIMQYGTMEDDPWYYANYCPVCGARTYKKGES